MNLIIFILICFIFQYITQSNCIIQYINRERFSPIITLDTEICIQILLLQVPYPSKTLAIMIFHSLNNSNAPNRTATVRHTIDRLRNIRRPLLTRSGGFAPADSPTPRGLRREALISLDAYLLDVLFDVPFSSKMRPNVSMKST